MRSLYRTLITVLTSASLIAGCDLPDSTFVLESDQPAASFLIPTPTPFLPLSFTPSIPPTIPVVSGLETQPAPAPVSPSDKLTIWVDASLPAALHQSVAVPPGFERTTAPESADLLVQVGTENVLSSWVYALVAPFPTVMHGVSSEALRLSWGGQPTGPFENRPLLVDQSTASLFAALWGEPAQGAILLLPEAEILEYAWGHPPAWALLPFEKLEPRWKVLEVDGYSPLRKDFDSASYPLAVSISLVGDARLVELVKVLYGPNSAAQLLSPSNRAPEQLTTLALTGVTALVRATASTMERRGIKYPGQDVRDLLRDADITHISNEVPFARNCPFPNPVQEDLQFCSDPRYIELLEDVGTDIVELTGDHFQDWGSAAMLYTLQLYRERGWYYYGGGENLAEGRQALLLEHNGNRLAFIGCNGKGRGFAHAGPNNPGAVVCDFDWLQAEIPRLRSEGYLPIVTFQHLEYYTYQAMPLQKRDFSRVAQAGAVIVSGSQAHQPQAFEFLDEALIHYGLGNLFFDQFNVSQATRQAFIDRHVFYAGRHISTELLPIVFLDYARPRPMDPAERADLLKLVFNASGW
ncbi:MAG: CapA family protein [Anaerolineales bacterium]|nr:MAG: CapA family protein [Anaerolineales bacterium]